MSTTAYITHPALTLVGLLGLACVDRLPSDTDSAGSAGSTDGTNTTTTPTTSATTAGDTSSTTTTEGTSTSATSSTTPSSTTTSTTTPGTTGDTEESTDSGVDPACEDSEVAFGFALVPPPPEDMADVVLDWDCAVVDIVSTATTLELNLECTAEGEPVTPPPQLILTGTPTPASIGLLPDDAIHLRYERLVPFWIEESLRIDKAGDVLVLAAGHSSALNPFADLSLASIEPACPPTDDGCGPIQHESFALTIEGNAGQIHSREFVQIGQFGVWAERLTHFTQPPPQCRDVPGIWRSLGLLRLAE